jgi:hypothetical protein
MGSLDRRVSELDQSVGILLATRRKEHMISLAEMRRAAAIGDILDVDHAEGVAEPFVESVQGWYATFLTVVSVKASWQQLPYAERNQWYSTGTDRLLHARVAAAGTRAAWWWGRNRATSPRGAWCYLCDKLIRSYDVSSPMSHAARCDIMAHRAWHVDLFLKTAPSHTPEVSK